MNGETQVMIDRQRRLAGMKRILLVVATAALTGGSIGIACAWAFRLEGFGLALAALLLATPAVLVLTFLAAACYLLSKLCAPAVMRGFSTAALAAAVFVAGLVPTLLVGVYFLTREVARAQDYCESLAPLLDPYRRQTGHYPERIDVVAPPEPLPVLLAGHDFYARDGDSYILQFQVKDRLLGTVRVYEGTSGRWRESD